MKTHRKMNCSKKKIMIPLMIFLIGIIALSGLVCEVERIQQRQNKTTAELNAMTYAERMKNDLIKGISVTDTLQQILTSEDGRINQFGKVAEDMMTDSIQSIQIAPDGVVTDIYPETGNEAGKIDLINDKDRGEISRYARDNHKLIMQGPFQLKQGGYGIAIRNPVYLEDENEDEYFWGFTIAIIKVPDIFSETVKALSDFGYSYRLLKTVSPLDTTYEEVYSSGDTIKNPVDYSFELGGEQWKLEVMPKNGWNNNHYLRVVAGGGLLIVLLLTGLTAALLNIDEHRKNLKKLAVTDALTGIYNRTGFDEKVEAYLKQNPGKNCVMAMIDVDDFKLINDMYGHAYGDKALESLAREMEKAFPQNAILGRNGGDEFCIFLYNRSSEEAAEQIKQFTKNPKKFLDKGENQAFSISLGYAEYPACADKRTDLMRCADAALYEVKLHGKNGCMAFSREIPSDIRKQLGFALSDISENLPGAFIIYKADKENDEILFVNSELSRMAGCKNMQEFLAYTGRSFRNLIREDEQEAIEKSIWEQIESGNSNDYIHFHMKKADGTYLYVLDHGRIVDSSRYGKVFYVLIMDSNAMQEHYGK